MKIRVAYSENEREKERLLEWAVKRLFSDTKIKETAAKDGYLHTVLTVPKPPPKTTKQAVLLDYDLYMWYSISRTE